MKVAIVGPYPFLGGSIAGGVARVIDSLLQELAGHAEVTLIVPNSPADAQGAVHGASVIYLARNKGPGIVTYWTSDARRVAEALAQLKPDIVHYQGGAGVARATPDLTSVVTIHGIGHRDILFAYRGSWRRRLFAHAAAALQKKVERIYRRKIGNVIVINPYVAEELPDITGLRCFPIPNPTDRIFVDVPMPQDPRPRRIISVGRIGERKQTARAVAIVARTLKQDTQASAVFCGEPQDQAYLERCQQIAFDFGVSDRLSFPGNLPVSELRRALDEASVFLMTSHQETAPVAIAEAQSRGVPVLAPRAFGITSMIDPYVNGMFLLGSDPDQQAALLGQMLAHKWDRAMIREQACATYGPAIVAEQTLTAYRSILADR